MFLFNTWAEHARDCAVELLAVEAQGLRVVVAVETVWTGGVAFAVFIIPVGLLEGVTFTVLTVCIFVPVGAGAFWRHDADESKEVMFDI